MLFSLTFPATSVAILFGISALGLFLHALLHKKEIIYWEFIIYSRMALFAASALLLIAMVSDPYDYSSLHFFS